LHLALENLETAMAETEKRIAAVEDRIDAQGDPEKKAPRKPRKPRALPENLPRVERVIEPDSIAWSPLERHRRSDRWRDRWQLRATMATRLWRYGADPLTGR